MDVDTVVGCEPRVDYSSCDEAYKSALPTFYRVTLAIQGSVFFVASVALLSTGLQTHRRKVAPHKRPKLSVRLQNTCYGLGKDTVMQLKLGCWAYSLAAIVHHGSMLQPTPVLPYLAVEYSYSMYNILLIATVATTLRYWQEFMFNAAAVSRVPPPPLRLVDRLLLHVFSWQGCWLFIVITGGVCLGTDSWGLLSRDVEKWQVAVNVQHYYLSGVCFLISVGCMRTGSFQESYISSLMEAQAEILKGDAAFLRNLLIHKWLFRFSFVGNSLAWVTCFLACGVGGVFFDEFYELERWLLLAGYFNFAGLFFAAICGVLNSPGMREAELRLHDLLAYCNLASQSQAEPQLEAGSVGISKSEPKTTKKVSDPTSSGTPVSSRASIQSWLTNYSMYTGKMPEEWVLDTTEQGGASAHAYPCYVMSLEDISQYDRLPTHEEALRDGTLRVVTRSSYWPCRSYVYFISQTWIDRSHPDGIPAEGSPKLQWMKKMAPKVLANGKDLGDVFLWMDIFSIPQATEEFQKLGIASLPAYASLVGGFLPLIQDVASIDYYQRRGWCMVECICALTPKENKRGEWRIGPHPTALQFQFYGDQPSQKHLVTLKTLKNPADPLETDFTIERDRQIVEPIYSMCAQIMFCYAESGATSWNHTYDIEDRPGWLKSMGNSEGEDTFTL